MKKFLIILLLGLVFNPLSGFSQNYKDRGDSAFNSGKYTEAINQYNAALAYLKSKKVAITDKGYTEIERQLVRAQKCAPLMTEAERLFSTAQTADGYTAAKKVYQSILKINVNDHYSRGKINLCNQKIEQIAMRKADNEMWAKMSQGEPSKAMYQQYLSEFPDGVHAKDAKLAIQEFEDKDLWLAARRTNTKQAYKDYLAKRSAPTYDSEAQMAIFKIEDDELWASILAEDTETAYNRYVSDTSNPAKGHQEEAVAKLLVIKAKKMDESISTANGSKRSGAKDIVETLEKASKTITLSEEDSEMLKYYKSINDYNNFYKLPTISSGLMYLKTYPDSEYADWVSNKVSELYANNLSATSTENDYQLARRYARSASAQKYVDSRFKALKKGVKASQRREAWSDRAQLGVGLDVEMLNSLAMGPRMEFKLGAADNRFNFSVGAKALWWNPEYLNSSDIQSIPFIQVPLYATIKLNLFRTGAKSHFYIGGEGAYNLNLGAKIGDATSGYISDDELVNRTNLSASARIGFCWRHGDFSLYYRHDLAPVYNQEYIYRQYNECYTNIEKVLNERFRLGFSYTFYFIF